LLYGSVKQQLNTQMRPAMCSCVVDSSALIAILRKERGAGYVRDHARGAAISSVNLAEVLSYTLLRGAGREPVEALLRAMQLTEVPFDREQCDMVASIYTATLGSSVGFADRACLALAKSQDLPALTGDHAWLQHDIGVEVLLFRQSKRK